MKNLSIVIIFILTAINGFGQNMDGDWTGKVNPGQGDGIEFVFHISEIDEGLKTVIDIPSKRIVNLQPKLTIFRNDSLYVDGSNLGFIYRGKIRKEQITGVFKEGVNELELNLIRGTSTQKSSISRPQEPVKPYPYIEEEVIFINPSEGITLAGTLTLPHKDGVFPAVVLITGSGPQDRDETFAEHKPFLVLADYLTRYGIAVLRYDDRGVGKSSGVHSLANTYDFALDALSAVDFLKTRPEVSSIGIIGHSEGGIIAPIVANQSKDISFIISMAGTAIPGSELIIRQAIDMRGFPVPDERTYEANIREAIRIAATDEELSIIKSKLKTHYENNFSSILLPMTGSVEKMNEVIVNIIETRTSPWIRYFYNYNPADEFEKVDCPVLHINGNKDVQVNASQNQKALKEALEKGKNTDYEIVEFEGLNHFFQECKTGTMDEYSQIEQTISPMVLEKISEWTIQHSKNSSEVSP